MSPAENPTFKTTAASRYLIARGVGASRSFLEKVRARGADDPRDRGPDFVRDENGICLYTQRALDAYISERLKARKFRAPAPLPANFRKEEA